MASTNSSVPWPTTGATRRLAWCCRARCPTARSGWRRSRRKAASYSLAIALAECAEAFGSDVPMQIFATDLNATGIATARIGVYPKSIVQDVSAERLEKFFVEESDGYRICKTIRDRCIFSRHNVLGDPPFSRVDVIPPGVIVSSDLEIVQFRGDTGPYLTPAAGAASLNLLKMLREGLLLSVRAAILRATDEKCPVRENGLRVKDGTDFREVAQVIPIQPGESNAGGFLVLFEEDAVPVTGYEPQPTASRKPIAGDEEISRLTQELVATREYLQAVIEQQEAINEELQSDNEEAQSSNEEMQSVNEELETSKEEIQSSNEELATVNDELNNRNVELSELNDSLRLARDYAASIVASMRSPLVVLDARLRVKTASAAFYDTFHATPERTEARLIYDLAACRTFEFLGESSTYRCLQVGCYHRLWV